MPPATLGTSPSPFRCRHLTACSFRLLARYCLSALPVLGESPALCPGCPSLPRLHALLWGHHHSAMTRTRVSPGLPELSPRLQTHASNLLPSIYSWMFLGVPQNPVQHTHTHTQQDLPLPSVLNLLPKPRESFLPFVLKIQFILKSCQLGQ